MTGPYPSPSQATGGCIQVLSSFVAERIAAGEVIERPSSVVKELVENSLDAGATEIAVILEDGGKALIEIIDNGSGMPPEDLALCVKRHATSKLRSLDDLERISTLGFRGEALPSVGAVSDMSIVSRAKDSETSYELTSNPSGGMNSKAQAITFGHFLGSAHGTRIQARGLFSQIPARLKFLKSQGAEVGQVREWLERLALTHPHVGFRLVSNDKSILSLRPQDEVSRVKAILSDGEDYPVISFNNDGEHHAELEGIRVRAHWIQGLSSPQTRKLVQVVNKRAVKDRVIQQALLSPFKQALLPGQFPAVALFLDVPLSSLDVNVHPTKTEIRFLQSSKVFRAIESMIEKMIAQHGAMGYAASSNTHGGAPLWNASEATHIESSAFRNQPRLQSNWNFERPFAAGPAGLIGNAYADAAVAARETRDRVGGENFSEAQPSVPTHPFQPHRYTGVIFNTYLLYDLGDELGMIDQHAAHERVRYEKLKTRMIDAASRAGSQVLLIPETVSFNAEQRPTLQERLPTLETLGFEVELFGEDSVVFRAIPGEWGTQELRSRLKNLIERLLAFESASHQKILLDEKLFESLASEACHSAIRAGDRIGAYEAASLMEALFSCEHPWNCPHGRPTVARVPRARFEEWFQRKI